MPTFLTLLTNTGLAKIAAAATSGIPLQLTHLAVGDGNGNPVVPAAAQTTLAREVYRGILNSLAVDAVDATKVIAELTIASDQGGWAIREAGLFDVDGDMIAVCNLPDTYKPVVADGSTRELIIRMVIQVGNASAVTISVDPTVVIATRAWVLSSVTPALLFPGGTTTQVLAKKSNADGDTEWRDPTAALNITVDVVKEIQTAADGQDVFTLGICTTDGVAVYIEGAREFTFTVLNQTQLQLSAGLPAGTKVLFVQNEPNEPLNLRKMAAAKSYFMGQFV